MAAVSVKELLEAGVHYGHHTSRWNPKMRAYIYGQRNSIHIINLVETLRGLLRAAKFLKLVAARGEEILLVGTKRQAAAVIAAEAQSAELPFVNERWLGGTLTNFKTIRSRLGRLLELEELEESGGIANYSKKEAATLMRERRKIQRNLDGLRTLNRHPGAMVVVDPKREKIAVLEANKLGIPVVALMDSDSNPDRISIPIPGNDDAIKSIQLICRRLVAAVVEGRELARGKVTPLERAPEGPASAEETPGEGAAEAAAETPPVPAPDGKDAETGKREDVAASAEEPSTPET